MDPNQNRRAILRNLMICDAFDRSVGCGSKLVELNIVDRAADNTIERTAK
jgi:hypothetical protein